MIGMNQHTGRAISGLEHLFQSIARILTTPRGSRVGRRDFGSDLALLIDAPNNAATRVRLYAAIATALMRWEPRLKLTRVSATMDPANPGALTIDVQGIATATAEPIETSVTVSVRRAA